MCDLPACDALHSPGTHLAMLSVSLSPPSLPPLVRSEADALRLVPFVQTALGMSAFQQASRDEGSRGHMPAHTIVASSVAQQGRPREGEIHSNRIALTGCHMPGPLHKSKKNRCRARLRSLRPELYELDLSGVFMLNRRLFDGIVGQACPSLRILRASCEPSAAPEVMEEAAGSLRHLQVERCGRVRMRVCWELRRKRGEATWREGRGTRRGLDGGHHVSGPFSAEILDRAHDAAVARGGD